MNRTVIHGLIAIAIGALAGMIVGGVIESLVHTVQHAWTSVLQGGVPAGLTDSDVMAAIVDAGSSGHLIAGALGGFVGFVGSTIRDAYRAAYRDAVARDDWGRVVVGGLVLAVVIGAGVFSVGDLALITAIGGFAAGTGVGAVTADI
ncbi:hypothetical protein AB0H37_14290 [Actinomadura sp. NPDC023710]|uniref:hypothetical protein n=1 Tax=Actinomadura sp. NPDC023710 TaxID=3158219 RepID=UPI0033E933B3